MLKHTFVLRLERKFHARHTFLTSQAIDAIDLGKSPPTLDSEFHALPLVAFASSETLEVTATQHPEWQRAVDQALRANLALIHQ